MAVLLQRKVEGQKKPPGVARRFWIRCAPLPTRLPLQPPSGARTQNRQKTRRAKSWRQCSTAPRRLVNDNRRQTSWIAGKCCPQAAPRPSPRSPAARRAAARLVVGRRLAHRLQRRPADAADRRHERDVPGAAHLLHRPQLRRARARDGVGSEPRAAVLLPEAERRDPVRRASARPPTTRIRRSPRTTTTRSSSSPRSARAAATCRSSRRSRSSTATRSAST